MLYPSARLTTTRSAQRQQVGHLLGQRVVPGDEDHGHPVVAEPDGVDPRLVVRHAVHPQRGDGHRRVGVRDHAARVPRTGVVADEGGAVELAVIGAADALGHAERLVADDDARSRNEVLRAQVAHLPVAVVDDDLGGAGLERRLDGCVRLAGHERAAAVVVHPVDGRRRR